MTVVDAAALGHRQTAEKAAEKAAEETAEETANLRTVDLLVPLWNRHDVAAILGHYDDAITWRNVAMGETHVGKEEVGAFLTDLFAAVPDLSMTITRRVPHGRFVAEEYTLRGTHLGNLLGIPATGRTVEVPAVSFVELRDARLLEDHFYFDVSTVLRQVGLFPPLSVARTPVGRRLMQVLVAARSPRQAWRLHRLRTR